MRGNDMKKWIYLLMVAMLVLFITSATAAEEEKTCGDYSYVVLKNGTAAIAQCNRTPDVLRIPEELDGYRVTEIRGGAFYPCKNLKTVTIPDRISSEDKRNPFDGCVNLESIKVSPDHPSLAVIDGVLFAKNEKRLICYPIGKKASSYTIPQGVQIIGFSAFDESPYLTSVTIPESITSIGNSAFYG